ncbi:MAG: M81 family metallopeptidase [Thalassobaculales bacterium]
MRMFVASFATETNTFAPLPVDRAAFERAFYAPPGRHPPTPTLCTAPIVAARARAAGGEFTLIEGTATWAEPAGLVSRSAFESIRDEILGQLRAAMPVDIALFGLHGAMVADGYEDCEGDLLARAREILGPRAIIGAEHDLHCHLTPKRVAACDLLILFKEFPHTDFLARAEELVDLSLRAARGEIRPVAGLFDCRLLGGGFMTNQPQGRAFIDRITAMEGRDGVLSISIGHGFSAGDVPEAGTKVLVYTDGDAARAAALAEAIGREVRGFERTAGPKHYTPEEAVAHARAHQGGPVAFGDRWDSPGGGVPGDSTIMISTLMAHPDLPAAIGVMWDPIAVELCRGAGTGGNIWLRMGGKATPVSGPPVDAEVVVKALSDDLVIPFEQSLVSLGPAAAVTIGTLDIVMASKRSQTFSPEAFTRMGIDIAAKKMLVVKSSNHFSAAFARAGAAIRYLDTGGPFPHDPLKVTYRRVRRPIAPLDAGAWA